MKPVLFFIMIAISQFVLSACGEEKVGIEFSYHLSGNMLTYDLLVSNNKGTDVLLTDTNGSYYSIDRKKIFIELYAHSQDEYSAMGDGSVFMSSDTRKLHPGEKFRLHKTVRLESFRFNNFYESKKNENQNFQGYKAEILIGCISSPDNDVNPSYNELNYLQSVMGLMSKKDFMELNFNQKMNYLFRECKRFPISYDQKSYCTWLSESVNPKFVIHSLFDKSFSDSEKFDLLLRNLERLLNNNEFENDNFIVEKVIFVLEDFIKSYDRGILLKNDSFYSTVCKLRDNAISKTVSAYKERIICSSKLNDYVFRLLGKEYFSHLDSAFGGNYSYSAFEESELWLNLFD